MAPTNKPIVQILVDKIAEQAVQIALLETKAERKNKRIKRIKSELQQYNLGVRPHIKAGAP